MKSIHTEIEIDAAPERVWTVLTDFASFPSWNPFISKISGKPATGEKLEVRLESKGGRAMTFRPRVKAADAPRELRWLGHLAIPGLFSGEHRFRIEPMGEGRSRFIQEESFWGLLVPLMAKTLDRDTSVGFAGMNAALKKRAEEVQS